MIEMIIIERRECRRMTSNSRGFALKSSQSAQWVTADFRAVRRAGSIDGTLYTKEPRRPSGP